MELSWKRLFMTGVLVGGIFVSGSIFDSKTEQTAENQTKQEKKEEKVEPKLIELPFGGRNLLPTYRFIALYGNPEYSGLGALGEQPLDQTIQRVKGLAKTYQELSTETVIPTFEIITTVASAGPTSNDDYSQEISIEKLAPWIQAAKQQGIYVILDLQPGRASFLSQAKLYEPLLKEPNVGLALDPEWRLLSKEARHLTKIGSVSAEEINQTSQWLADLTKNNKLPQKIFMVHQFKLSMITERETLKTNRKELAYILHMDGHGSLGSKTRTWNTIKRNLPENIYLGWKNFYDEDKPTPTPQQTMQQIPKPWLISYQ